uniref:Uncharacterized protein n=1 Tax=Heterorhabditis bacteriophora TaxID=37862 RepID=A0A1I7XGU4_HETBA
METGMLILNEMENAYRVRSCVFLKRFPYRIGLRGGTRNTFFAKDRPTTWHRARELRNFGKKQVLQRNSNLLRK